MKTQHPNSYVILLLTIFNAFALDLIYYLGSCNSSYLSDENSLAGDAKSLYMQYNIKCDAQALK